MSFARCAAVLLILTCAIWAPTIGYGMVYEDKRDAPLTLEPSAVIFQMSLHPTRVVTLGSRWLELELCGVSASCFHTGNLLIHAANVLLLFSIAWLYLPPWGALAVALVFAVHPLQTEAVSYVSARSDLLATTGLLLALLSASFGSLTGALVGVLFACVAKETAIVAWGLVLLWAAWTHAWPFARRWALIVAVGAALVGVIIWQKIYGLEIVADQYLVGSQLAAVWRLLALVPLPVGLTIDHDWAGIAYLGPVALIASLGVTAWALTEGWWGRHWLAFGWLWTLVAVSPRLVVPLYEGLHERHFYAITIGWALCAGAWLSKLSAREGEPQWATSRSNS